MKPLPLLIALLFVATVGHSQSTTDTLAVKFANLVTENKMEFTMPSGTTPIPIVKNMQMHYEYAVKFNDKPIEIRYAIASMTDRVAEYKKFLKDKPPGSSMIEPNQTSKAIAYAVATNVGGGIRDPQVRFKPFPPEHIKPEFGADWGGTWVIPVKNNSFGTDYKFCIMTVLHRDDVADAYIMYLGNTPQELVAMFQANPGMGGLFYALKFKQ
jgi:hypothetical protein